MIQDLTTKTTEDLTMTGSIIEEEDITE